MNKFSFALAKTMAIFSMIMLFATIGQVRGADQLVQKGPVKLYFYNDTDATIQIKSVDGHATAGTLLVTVNPRSKLFLNVNAGKRLFDLVAFKAKPVRIHRIKLHLKAGKESHFRIIAHRFHLYILADAESLINIPVLSPIPPTPGRSTKRKSTLMIQKADKFCKPHISDDQRVVIWDPSDKRPAKYFRARGSFLCALDGSEVYKVGAIYENYRCRKNWTHCDRSPNNDARVLPPLRTAGFIDAAMQHTQRLDPGSYGVETSAFEWTRTGRSPSRISDYNLSPSSKGKMRCPLGFRLHWRGHCIKVANELADDPKKGGKMVEPIKTK